MNTPSYDTQKVTGKNLLSWKSQQKQSEEIEAVGKIISPLSLHMLYSSVWKDSNCCVKYLLYKSICGTNFRSIPSHLQKRILPPQSPSTRL